VVGKGLDIIEASRSHSVKRTTVGRIPLDEWTAQRRELYLAIHNNHKRQTSIRTHILNKREAADPRLRPRGHWSHHTVRNSAGLLWIMWWTFSSCKCDNFVTSWVTNSFSSYTSVECEHSLPSLPEIVTGTNHETNEYRETLTVDIRVLSKDSSPLGWTHITSYYLDIRKNNSYQIYNRSTAAT